MSSQAYATPPDLAELMRMFQMDDIDDSLALDDSSPSPLPSPPPDREFMPPAPLNRHSSAHSKPSTRQIDRQPVVSAPLAATTASYNDAAPQSRFRRTELSGVSRSSGWNGSTQVMKGTAKPLKHQILCRNFVPPAPTYVERKSAQQLLHRLSKATISSRMKEATAAAASTTSAFYTAPAHKPEQPVEIDRKRLHIQQKHAIASQNVSASATATPIGGKASRSPDMRGGREGIQLLLFYRKEVEKRLRADPLYGLQPDTPV